LKHKVLKLMAYIYMPLIFTVLGYSVMYIAAAPVLDMLQAVGSMVIAKEVPQFHQDMKSIYSPGNEKSKDKIVSVKDIKFPDSGTHFANLTCKRIALDAPVYWGDTADILKVGAGQFMGSFLPGFGKSMLISAHNTTYFKPLQYAKKGDVITYKTNYGVFQYKITEVKVINENVANNMRNVWLSYKKEKLMMYTCYPFKTLVGRKTNRLFIFADKISGPTVQ
jgi:sortase A